MNAKQIQMVYDVMQEFDSTLITKLVIYRELCRYLFDDEINNLLPAIYERYLRNEIWIDLGTFSNEAAKRYLECKDITKLLDKLIKSQGEAR